MRGVQGREGRITQFQPSKIQRSERKTWSVRWKTEKALHASDKTIKVGNTSQLLKPETEQKRERKGHNTVAIEVET